MKQYLIPCFIIAAIVAYTSEIQLSSDTSWETPLIADGGCMMTANSSGVELQILSWPPDLYSISLSRPSMLNDLIHGSISWPSQSAFDLDHNEEDIFAIFNSMKPNKLDLKMAHAGGSDGEISSFTKNDVFEFSSLLTRYNDVDIYKNYFTTSGIEITRLGGWAAKTDVDRAKILDFYHCLRKVEVSG